MLTIEKNGNDTSTPKSDFGAELLEACAEASVDSGGVGQTVIKRGHTSDGVAVWGLAPSDAISATTDGAVMADQLPRLASADSHFSQTRSRSQFGSSTETAEQNKTKPMFL